MYSIMASGILLVTDLADVSLLVATGPASRMVLLWLVATAMHGTAPVAERMGVVVTHPLSHYLCGCLS